VCRVQNFVRDAQAFDWAVVQDVRLNNFVHVLRAYPAIEDAFRIDHYRGPKLTLIQAARFVCAYQLNPALRQFRLEQKLQFAFSGGVAASAGMALFSLVQTDENVFFEFRHCIRFASPKIPGRERKYK